LFAGVRALVVVRHLQDKGVDPSALEGISNGQYHPVVSNEAPRGAHRIGAPTP